jgi:hypothetical protein
LQLLLLRLCRHRRSPLLRRESAGERGGDDDREHQRGTARGDGHGMASLEEGTIDLLPGQPYVHPYHTAIPTHA